MTTAYSEGPQVIWSARRRPRVNCVGVRPGKILGNLYDFDANACDRSAATLPGSVCVCARTTASL